VGGIPIRAPARQQGAFGYAVSVDLTLARVTDFESIREEWSALAEGTTNIFATWEWASAWWRHLGRDGRLLLTACRDEDGRLTAVLPLYLWLTRPVRVARLIGHHAGDHLGPICRSPDRDRAAAALTEALARASVDVFIGEQLSAEEGWSDLLSARRLNSEGSPVLRIGHRTWEDYLGGRSRNFREQVRRRERKLIREHDLGFRLADDPDRLSEDLDVLFRLHRDRWGHETNFSSRERFHRDFAWESYRRGWLRLWFAELDGEPAAAWYGFRFADVESYYQAGWAAHWAETSVGFVLLAHTIREAFQNGMKEYRFLRGGEAYKYRFADSDPALETVALPRGPLGRVFVASATTLRRSQRLLATVVPRRSRSRQRYDPGHTTRSS
jgi:CelD/BcsL family acetyltransferase involved in cellulose biosynthesis